MRNPLHTGAKHTSEEFTLVLKAKADATRSPKRGISGLTKRADILTKIKNKSLPTSPPRL